ncbi:MAG: enoyl-CoA hydratase/isomerase family protein [Candidatus Brocadiales bacterium]|nr:enoyl-CoA hydratase/isomerase family protein [Candidatus Brocadiales bacterium]
MKDIRMNRGDDSGNQHLECEEVELQEDKYAGIIKMNKPPRNSIGSWLMDAIYDKIDSYEKDNRISTIIITSSIRRVFCDGADQDELFGSWISGLVAEKNYDRFVRAHEMFIEIENCRKPLIAALNGITIGAGLELALLCDIRIASEIAFFSLPEAKPELSIIPGLGGTIRLSKAVGAARAKEMLFFGKMIRAKKALEWGLVNALAPAREVLNESIELARKLAKNNDIAIENMKKCINYAVDHDIRKGIEYEVELFAEMMRLKLVEKSLTESTRTA